MRPIEDYISYDCTWQEYEWFAYRFCRTLVLLDGQVRILREVNRDDDDVFLYFDDDTRLGLRDAVDGNVLVGRPRHGWVGGETPRHFVRTFESGYKWGWQPERDTSGDDRWHLLVSNNKHVNLERAISNGSGALSYNYALVDGSLMYKNFEVGSLIDGELKVADDCDFVLLDPEYLTLIGGESDDLGRVI